MSNRTTLEQGRAAFAYEAAKKGSELSKNSEYKAYVKKMPMYIKTNGLGAAMSFAFAKGSKGGVPVLTKAWGLIYSQIEDWLKNNWDLVDFDKKETIMGNLLILESPEYRATTIEVLALLNWMRRFAEGLITKEN
ncbi:MAG: type III-B CRISPR module-associated protein Cmr5 [Chitinophagales bacterium]